MKNQTAAIVGALGAVGIRLFGGMTAPFGALLLFMGLDYLTGLVVAAVFRRSNKSEGGALDSNAGWRGLAKKGGALAVVLVAHWLDIALGSAFVRDAVIIAFLANETLSIIENVGAMGVPIPAVLRRAIEALRAKGSDEDIKN